MKTIKLDNEQLNIYDIHDFPYHLFENCSTVEKSKRSPKRYVDIVCTFDIETTTMKKEECDIFNNDFGFMYIWQFCIDGYLVIGRTWEEYKAFINTLKEHIDTTYRKLVVYVHNLSFEFQFMHDFFNVSDVFCRKKRDVVYCVMEDVEYRCSLTLSNMGLSKFLEKTKNVKHNKLSGDKFNYSIKRYPDTELTDYELAYCVYDVLGLYEAIKEQLKEDTLCTIPITSTGYVRRDYKEKCLQNTSHMKQFKNISLNERTYLLCREASRGAISGSNHIHTNERLQDVDSFDIKSSYPFQMATKYFPTSRFIKYNVNYYSEKFEKLIDGFCCIIVWSCKNFKLKHWESIPYISKAKCRAIENGKCGNGKVYMADKIGMCCTEIDFKIIREHYTFEDVQIYEMWCAQRGTLSKAFREHLMFMFQMKTNLEDGDIFLYNKYKNKINASFGMMLTDILHPEIIFHPNSTEIWTEEEIPDIDKALNEYYRSYNSFLSYQHGVWILAHARDDLMKGMDIVKHDLVQVDTDSVKTLGDYKEEFNELNQSIIDKAENYDVKPYSMKNGKKHYLGIWEHEGKDNEYTYKEFKTLGAKKYAYISEDDKMHITVAGLKKSAAKWLQNKGGLDIFKNGTIVPPGISGRTSSLYNDFDHIETVNINGHTVTLGSNIAIRNINYTFGQTGEWLLLILDGKVSKDYIPHFNGAYKGWM